MNHPANLFDFAVNELPAITAARELAVDLEHGIAITRKRLADTFTRITGATDADNQWSVSDTHAAVELAQLLWLRDHCDIDTSSSGDAAFAVFDRLDGLTPIHYNRSEEQVSFQQFSTPLRLAWIAARAAAITDADIVLEPSAGTGMLAFWAQRAGARLALNEIHPLRREALRTVFQNQPVSAHDGELIDELLDPAISPAIVIMNPPYSVGLERGQDGRTGARHLRSAFRRLVAKGRLVAIMPD